MFCNKSLLANRFEVRLLIRFEEMKEDQKSAIHQVCHFLGVQLSEEKVTSHSNPSYGVFWQVECLLKHLAFEKMKMNPAVNPFASAVKPKGLRGHFVREGKVIKKKETKNKRQKKKETQKDSNTKRKKHKKKETQKRKKIEKKETQTLPRTKRHKRFFNTSNERFSVGRKPNPQFF